MGAHVSCDGRSRINEIAGEAREGGPSSVQVGGGESRGVLHGWVCSVGWRRG